MVLKRRMKIIPMTFILVVIASYNDYQDYTIPTRPNLTNTRAESKVDLRFVRFGSSYKKTAMGVLGTCFVQFSLHTQKKVTTQSGEDM